VEFCVQKANSKLAENFARIDKFEEQLNSLLAKSSELTTRVKRERPLGNTIKEDNKLKSDEDVCDIFGDFSLNQDL
jgi:Asp-tRNA(Asn)/Glu-tRNA(Gln) amidotransferase C subunit